METIHSSVVYVGNKHFSLMMKQSSIWAKNYLACFNCPLCHTIMQGYITFNWRVSEKIRLPYVQVQKYTFHLYHQTIILDLIRTKEVQPKAVNYKLCLTVMTRSLQVKHLNFSGVKKYFSLHSNLEWMHFLSSNIFIQQNM